MNFEDIIVKVDKPYPEIVGATEDYATVAVLKNLANSKIGELNGVLQYIYQSVIADRVNAEIASIFEEIGIVEMMHLSMLMHAITDFGGIPKYEDANGVPFNVSSLNYSVKLIDMLKNNIKGEQFAIENYKQATNKIKNQSLKELLNRFILDEEHHLEIFKQILNNVEFMSV